MRTLPARRSIVPMVLGIAMLGVVLSAAMAPDTGAVPAVASSQYSSPPPPQTFLGLSPIESYGLLALILALAVLAGLVFVRRRRRAAPTTEEEGPAPPESAPPEPVAPDEPPAGASDAYDEGTAPAPEPAPETEPSPEIDDLMKELDRISKELNGGPGPPPEP